MQVPVSLLQQFAWTEEDLERKLERRNTHIRKVNPALTAEPMFCLEHAIKLFFWSVLIYDYPRMRAHISRYSCPQSTDGHHHVACEYRAKLIPNPASLAAKLATEAHKGRRKDLILARRPFQRPSASSWARWTWRWRCSTCRSATSSTTGLRHQGRRRLERRHHPALHPWLPELANVSRT